MLKPKQKVEIPIKLVLMKVRSNHLIYGDVDYFVIENEFGWICIRDHIIHLCTDQFEVSRNMLFSL